MVGSTCLPEAGERLMSEPNAPSARPRVCFLTLVLSHYRVRFHELVREKLARDGIDYDVVYSDPVGDDQSKRDTVELTWGHKVPVRSFRVLGQDFFWQDALDRAGNADLTIVSQESKLLINYLLQARYWLRGRPKFAFFGHGKGHGVGAFGRQREIWKRFLATRVHWWFAYTRPVADLLRNYGFPADHITVNNNTIDVDELTTDLSSVGPEEIAAFRAEHGLGEGPIGTFIGAIYPAKRVQFLIEAAHEIRRRVPDFQLVIAGAGSDAARVQEAASTYDFIHALPPRFGKDKAILLKASRALLIPGAIGLVAIDSFAAACPIVTCAGFDHGPELDYLEHDTNALVLPKETSVEGYAAEAARVLTDEALAERLSAGAATAARSYSIENMAENVAEGIRRALAAPARAKRV